MNDNRVNVYTGELGEYEGVMFRNMNDVRVHVGTWLYAFIVARGLSVSEVARALGVGRPALSNLLNCNSSLSWVMAIRLEKTLGLDAKRLMKHQFLYDQENAITEKDNVLVKKILIKRIKT